MSFRLLIQAQLWKGRLAVVARYQVFVEECLQVLLLALRAGPFRVDGVVIPGIANLVRLLVRQGELAKGLPHVHRSFRLLVP